jgi:hypothetical protein
MFSHLGAVLLASGALVLLSTAHSSISTGESHPQASIALVAAPGAVQPGQRGQAAPAVRAIAIGY